MVKPPKIRHSKPRRDPVTIDLDPTDVKRDSGRTETADAEARSAGSPGKAESARTTGEAAQADATSSKSGKTGSPVPNPPPASGDASARASPPSASGTPPKSAGVKEETVADSQTKSEASPAMAATEAATSPAGANTDPKNSMGGRDAEARKPASASGSANDEKLSSGGSKPDASPAAAGTSASSATGKSDATSSASTSGSVPSSPGPAAEARGSQPAFGRGGAAASTLSSSQKNDRKDEPAPAASPATRDTSRRGGVSAIAAGIIGAAIALIGLGGLQYAGVLPGFGPAGTDESEVVELRAQIAALREEIAATGPADTAADQARVDELATALEQVRSQVSQLQATAQDDTGMDTQALQARLTELESTLASLQGAEAGASPDEVAGLEEQVAGLSEQVSTLGERVSSLEGQATSASDAASAAQDAASAIQERLGSIETSLQELSDEVEAQAADSGPAVAIAAAALKAAIDRGDPFMAELETFAAVAPEAPEVAALRELAATGVPTRAAITEQFDLVADRMIEAAEPVDQDAGYFDRLLDSMGSLVSVRPIGDIEGEGVGPTVARMEAALAAGNYERAIEEYATLPEPAQAAGADFIADVRARQAADDLVSRALAGALRA